MNEHERDVVFSTGEEEWQTPLSIMQWLRSVFPFTLDVCATPENAQCAKFFTKQDDAFRKYWSEECNDQPCYMNPPYGRGVTPWIAKAHEEAKFGAVVVCLLPARTSNEWFHKYCADGRVIFIEHRIQFVGASNSAPFPSMIVIFDDYNQYPNAIRDLGASPMRSASTMAWEDSK